MYLDNWQNLTSYRWTLQTIQGYRLEWSRKPQYRAPIPSQRMTLEEQELTNQEITDLLTKKAIAHSTTGSGFFSSIFLVPKKDGGWRPVINLKMLNSYIVTQHFKMETISSLKDVIKQGDWLGKIDLKDAYLTIPVHPPDQKYLIHVEGTGLPIHLFTLRSVDRTESLLEGDATSDGSAEGERGTDDPVPGRYPSTFRVEGEALFPHTDSGYSTRRSRLPIEQEEVSADPLPGNRVLGVHGQLGQPVTHPARRESQENQGVPKIAKLTSYLREKSCSPDRPTQLNYGRSSSCPPLLQGSTAVEKSGGHPQRRQLRNRVHCGCRVSHRFEVVGGPFGSLQRPTNNAPFSRIGDRVRCLNQRMGSALQRLPDRRALERPRSNSTHQHSRAEGMFPGSPNICIRHDELPCVTANGQSDGSVLCQQERRNSFEGPIRPGLRHLAMVLVE